jgi:hypothetical protein
MMFLSIPEVKSCIRTHGLPGGDAGEDVKK